MELEAPVYALALGENNPPQIQGMVPTPSTTRENSILLSKFGGGGGVRSRLAISSEIIENHRKLPEYRRRYGCEFVTLVLRIPFPNGHQGFLTYL